MREELRLRLLELGASDDDIERAVAQGWLPLLVLDCMLIPGRQSYDLAGLAAAAGIDEELAREHGIPVILVVERDRTVSRLLLGNPAVVEVVRFGDLDGLRRSLVAALERVRDVVASETGQAVSDDVVVQRFLASLEQARHLPDGEVAALLRIGELDGEASLVIRDAVATGRLFGAGLRDLVGRYALRGADLGVFVLRDVLERPLAETARMVGSDPRAVKRRLEAARSHLGLTADAKASDIAQWLVTELIAPPTRALQLHLFDGGRSE